MTKVDYVVVVDAIGDPKKIATGAAKPTTDMRKLMMADYCTQFVVNSPYFKEGFSYQTGVGGASIASTISLGKIMEERGIHMGFGVGGITTPMCDLLEKGLIRTIVDTQDFDLGAIESIKKNPNHIEISASEYANPMNKGAYVNRLDFVILAALEVDVNFNCNVVVGSDGVITGAQGGHPDTAAGAKCTIVIAPLLQGRIPAICSEVTTVTTPGESIDVVITDYGIAIGLYMDPGKYNTDQPGALKYQCECNPCNRKTERTIRILARRVKRNSLSQELADKLRKSWEDYVEIQIQHMLWNESGNDETHF